MRIGLFLLTNLAIMVLVGIVLSIFGFDGYMAANGRDLDLQALLIYCAVFGFIGSFFSLFISKWAAKRSTGTQIIAQARTNDEKWLLDTVEDLSRKAGIKMPEVGIFPAQDANAFATGWNKNDALVAVSLGLLQRFDREEVKAVLAHEIGHVANGDMVTLSLVQGIVNTFVFFFSHIIGHFVDRVILKNEEGHGLGFFVANIVSQIVLGFLASMIVAAFSRYREYRADHAGAELAGRNAMISALARLKAETEAKVPSSMPDSMYAFGINAGFKQQLFKLFASHPPLELRIQALKEGK